jgi:hypothetical protein
VALGRGKVNEDHNDMAVISSEVTVKGCKECCLSNAVDGTDGMLCNDSEEDGYVRSQCEEDEHAGMFGVTVRKMSAL